MPAVGPQIESRPSENECPTRRGRPGSVCPATLKFGEMARPRGDRRVGGRRRGLLRIPQKREKGPRDASRRGNAASVGAHRGRTAAAFAASLFLLLVLGVWLHGGASWRLQHHVKGAGHMHFDLAPPVTRPVSALQSNQLFYICWAGLQPRALRRFVRRLLDSAELALLEAGQPLDDLPEQVVHSSIPNLKSVSRRELATHLARKASEPDVRQLVNLRGLCQCCTRLRLAWYFGRQ